MTKANSLMARATQLLLDVFAAFTGAYYSRKLAAVARWLGLSRMTSTYRRGYIIVQIDGLAYEHLTQAIDLGYAPNLQRMLRRGRFVLRRFFSGLPSTTPAVQGAIMYGTNEGIPGFRWFDKSAGEPIVCTAPSNIRVIQDRLSSTHRGILRGGSSFMNMFDGDASLSLFTLGAWNEKRFFESVRGLGLVLLFIMNPFRVLKMFWLSLWEYATDLVQRGSALLRCQARRPRDRRFPFLRLMSNIVLREMQTFAVLVDIYRGVPAIYTTYYGYDEISHHFGCMTKPALRALHAIDVRVRQIDALRRLGITREYDLYILSDHGMTAAEPFRLRYGETLGEYIRECVAKRAEGHPDLSEAEGRAHQDALPARYLADELAVLERNVSEPLARIPRKLRRLALERIEGDPERDVPWQPERRTDLVVRNSGCLAHVYLSVSSEQLDLADVAALYPGLIEDVLSHPGVGIVAGREGDEVVLMGSRGTLTMGHDVRLDGENPLAGIEPLDAESPVLGPLARGLERLTRFVQAGDLVLLGTYDPSTETICCFEQLWACHGGVGGPQTDAILLVDPAIHREMPVVTGPVDIYAFLMAHYRDLCDEVDSELTYARRRQPSREA